jgi:hypothetical protein
MAPDKPADYLRLMVTTLAAKPYCFNNFVWLPLPATPRLTRIDLPWLATALLSATLRTAMNPALKRQNTWMRSKLQLTQSDQSFTSIRHGERPSKCGELEF